MRSESKKRQERRYGSAKERADKKAVSERGPYLKIPPDTKMFQPKVGVMLVDILPYEAGEGNPCVDEGTIWYERTFYVHRGVGANQEMYLCPRKTSKSKCPICEMREKLIRKGDDDNEELIKDMAPKERQLFNVKNLKEPEKGIQLWDISFHLFGKLLDTRLRNSDEQDDWDLFFKAVDGKTLKLGFEEDSYGGRTFNKVATIDFRERKEDYDEDELLKETHCLDDLVIESSYDEMKKAFLQTSDKDKDDDDDDEPRSKKKKEEEDDDDEPRSKKKKEEDDDEPPKKRHREDDDDEPPKKRSREEDEEEPKSRRSREDDDEPPKKRSRDDDDEDRPKSRRRDEEEEEKPKKRSRDDDDDEPPKKRSRDEADDDEPRKKKREEDDDEPPKKKSSRDDDDEPRSKKSKADDDKDWEDFDEEEKPKSKKQR